MNVLLEDHELSNYSVRIAEALYASTSTVAPERLDDEELTRFALGRMDESERISMIRRLVRSSPARARLLALRDEMVAGEVSSKGARTALTEALGAFGRVLASLNRPAEGEDFWAYRQILGQLAGAMRAGHTMRLATVRGDATAWRPLETGGAYYRLSVDLEGDCLLATADLRGAPDGVRLTLGMRDPSGTRVALVAEEVARGSWEGRVEGFASATGFTLDHLMPSDFELYESAEDLAETAVCRIPSLMHPRADFRSHGRIRFMRGSATIHLSASEATLAEYGGRTVEISLPLGTVDLRLARWPLVAGSDGPRPVTASLPAAEDGLVLSGSFLVARILE